MMDEFEYIFGPHCVEAALKAKKRKIDELYILQGNRSFREIRNNALKRKIKIYSILKISKTNNSLAMEYIII